MRTLFIIALAMLSLNGCGHNAALAQAGPDLRPVGTWLISESNGSRTDEQFIIEPPVNGVYPMVYQWPHVNLEVPGTARIDGLQLIIQFAQADDDSTHFRRASGLLQDDYLVMTVLGWAIYTTDAAGYPVGTVASVDYPTCSVLKRQ